MFGCKEAKYLVTSGITDIVKVCAICTTQVLMNNKGKISSTKPPTGDMMPSAGTDATLTLRRRRNPRHHQIAWEESDHEYILYIMPFIFQITCKARPIFIKINLCNVTIYYFNLIDNYT